MSKIKIETMGCYQQVVDVIGVEKAKVELFKAMESYVDLGDDRPWNIARDLLNCFYWKNTVQGNYFWHMIAKGRCPL